MICTTKWVLSNYINKERTWDHFIFASLSFSDFCNFSQIAKFRRRQKKVFAIFYMNSCAFPHIFYEFSKLKYKLNLFLWNSLQQSDAKIKWPKALMDLMVTRRHVSFIHKYKTLHKKWNFPLRVPSVNVRKSLVSCEFGQIYWRNS